MNKQELEQKFEEIYKAKIEPQLQELESYRLTAKKSFNKNITYIVCLIFIAFYGLYFNIFSSTHNKFQIYGILAFILFIVLMAVSIFFIIRTKKIYDDYRKYTKKALLVPILSVFGEFKLYTEKRTMLYDIQGFGLYPAAEQLTYDDVISGVYKNIPVSIEEINLTHEIETKNSSYTVIDFKGLLFKIKMNKCFNCKIVAGRGLSVRNPRLEKVVLEDVEINKKYKIFSDNQVECRYLMTPSFMERIKNIKTVFDSSYTDFVFNNNYFYLFLGSSNNFFEVGNVYQTLYNNKNYIKVFGELYSLFSLIDYFKLDQKTGL